MPPTARPTVAYKPKPGEIPTNPGVYRFRDADGRVLYVGKAKNLRARLSNYFAPLQTLHERTRRMVTTAASVEWTVVATDVDSLQLEYMWIKEFDPPFNVRYKDDKSYPFMAITLADEAPRVIVTRNRRIPGAKYFGPYPEGVGGARHHRPDDQGLPDPHLQRRQLQEGDGDRPPLLPRSDRPLRRPVLDEGHDRGAPRDRRRLHRVHVRRRPALHEGAHGADAGGLRRDGLRGGRGLSRPAPGDRRGAQPERPRARARTRTPISSASPRTSSPPTVQHFVDPRRPRPRCARPTTIDKELDISGADLVDQVLQRTYGDAPASDIPRQVLVPALPEDAAELEQWLRDKRERPVTIQVAQRGRKAELMKTATLNAQQALILHKTRRTQRLRRPFPGAHRPAGGARARRGAAAHRVLRRLAPRRHQRRRVDGRLRGRPAAQGPVPLVRRSRDDRRHRLALPGADPAARLRRPRRRGGRCGRGARGRGGARSRRRGGDDAQAPALRLPAAAARRRRRQAAGRGGGPRARRCRSRGDRAVRHREATRGGVAAGGGLPGDPAAHLARRSSCCSACATRRTDSRSRTSAGGGGATSNPCCPRCPASATRASRRCCGTSDRSPRSRTRPPTRSPSSPESARSSPPRCTRTCERLTAFRAPPIGRVMDDDGGGIGGRAQMANSGEVLIVTRHVRRRTIDRGERARRPRLVRRRQSAAADAQAAARSHRARRRRAAPGRGRRRRPRPRSVHGAPRDHPRAARHAPAGARAVPGCLGRRARAPVRGGAPPAPAAGRRHDPRRHPARARRDWPRCARARDVIIDTSTLQHPPARDPGRRAVRRRRARPSTP